MMGKRFYKTKVLLILTFVLCIFVASGPQAAQAEDHPWPETCWVDPLGGLIPNQIVLVCQPQQWNGTLILYAHGYVAPQLPLDLPVQELSQAGGKELISTLMDLGFAFMTTSYSQNGWALQAAEGDLNALVAAYSQKAGSPQKVLLTGASEGGLITTMMIEKYPEIYAGGLAMCGPVGGAPYQIQYVGDFRVVFDYFFPGVFDFGIADVPADAYLKWESQYLPAIQYKILNKHAKRIQLFSVTDAPMIPTQPDTAVDTAESLLWYSIFGTNNLIDLAGTIPYDNAQVKYDGSFNDRRLNRKVERVQGDPSYLYSYYQPTGNLKRPLVTLHTLIDGSVPYRHELIYREIVEAKGNLAYLTTIPVASYGHCNFTSNQVLGAFGLLFLQTEMQAGDALQGFIQRLPEFEK